MSNPADLVYTIAKDKLPDEWSLATISDLVGKDGVFVDGDWVESKDQDPDGDVRLIQLADIGDGEYRNRSDRFLTHEKAIQLGCTFLEKGDVLIARMPDPLGRACIFPGDQKRSVTVVDVAIVRPAGNAFDARWLMYFVNTPAFRSAVSSMQSGSTRKRISRGNLSKIVLPVPPLDQQKRVVAEIEKQFSRLDEAVANLKRVKANLKRYKSAVLKAAVAGVERAWPESQLADVCQIVSGFAFKSVDFCASGIPAIKIANVGYGEFLWKDQEYLPLSFHSKYQSFVVRPGDLLLALTRPITNGTVKVCRYPNDAPVALLNQRVAVLRPTEKAKPEFLLSLLQSEIFKAQLNDALSETLQPNLSPVDLKKFSVRLPGVHEQMHIIDEIDRRLSVLRETESQVGSNHQRAERLRQSILGRAFNAIANTYL